MTLPLSYPGIRIDADDPDWAQSTREMLSHLESCVLDAVLAAEMFARGVGSIEGDPILVEVYHQRILFLYAHAFLYAVDAFRKALRALMRGPNQPSALAAVNAQFEEAFPHARGIRNSAQHMEDRVRRLVRGKPLPEVPINTPLVQAPSGGMLWVGNLVGNKLSYTVEDGTIGEIEISPTAANRLAALFSACLALYKWVGPPVPIPIMMVRAPRK